MLNWGDKWMGLKVLDHPHWVKHDVYSKMYPLLALEVLRIGTIFFKSTAEILPRDYIIVGLSL